MIQQLLQFYVPLSGLVLMAFWVGALSTRVKQLEKTAEEDRKDTERLVRVETTLEAVKNELDGIQRSIDGLHRMMGNLISVRGSSVIELGVRGGQ